MKDSIKDTSTSYNYIHTITIALISGVFVFVWLFIYETLNKLIWDNNFITDHRYIIPIISIFFSLIVGFSIKYLKAPTCINGSPLESMGEPDKINWKNLPAAVVTSLASLLSGAVVGPEGAIGSFATDLAAFYNEKLKIPKEHTSKTIFASLSSAYNGLIENPIFTAVLANDLAKDKKTNLINLPSNLLAGTIGYFLFLVIGGTGLVDYLNLGQIENLEPIHIVYTILFAIVGVFLAVFTGLMFKVMAKIFSKFGDKIILKVLTAGVIFGIVGYFFPVIMFSGETQVFEVMSDPMKYGIGILVLMSFVKLILLSISFKSGFLGGPTFPTIFASVCMALAINTIFPGIPLILIIAGIMSGLLMLLFKAPFMVILLVSVFLGANTNLTALIVIGVVFALLINPILEKSINKR